ILECARKEATQNVVHFIQKEIISKSKATPKRPQDSAPLFILNQPGILKNASCPSAECRNLQLDTLCLNGLLPRQCFNIPSQRTVVCKHQYIHRSRIVCWALPVGEKPNKRTQPEKGCSRFSAARRTSD